MKLPASWSKVTLAELCRVKPNNGIFRKNPEYQNGATGGMPVVWVEELFRGNSIDVTNSRRVVPSANDVEKYGLKFGDLLFCRSSLKLDGIAFNNVYIGEDDKALFECHLIRVSPDLKRAYPPFLNWLLRSPRIRAQLKLNSKTATMTTIDQAGLCKIRLPLPPLSEQKRIAEILDRAEALRAKRRAALALLDELTQSIFLDMFGDPVSNPKGFPWGTMGDLFSVKHGFAFKSEYFCESADHILLTPGNFNETGGYRDRGEKTKFYSGPIPDGYVLQHEDMLVAMTEQAPGLLGSPLFVPESGVYLHNQRLGLVDLKASANRNFVFELLNTRAVRLAIQSSSTGTKVKHTSPSKLTAVRVPIPPINLQKRFALIVNELETVKSTGRSALAENRMLFASLQHRAFRGEL